MKDKKQLAVAGYSAVVWIVIMIVTLTVSTYAWFTGSSNVNVEPLSSTISDKGTNLLISNDQNGVYAETCELKTEGNNRSMYPVSTADLKTFYKAVSQNGDGIALTYKDVTDQINTYLIHGTVYLKAEGGACDIYFDKKHVDFGVSAQVLAGYRLGTRITIDGSPVTRIFKLDSMGNTTGAEAKRTIPKENQVVSSLQASGSANYTNDPSVDIADYCASFADGEDLEPSAGKQSLGSLEADRIAVFEYWLYPEGCDDNCSNSIQNTTAKLQLAFAGVAKQ